MVDPTGLEPATYRLRIYRSPRLSYGPIYPLFDHFSEQKAEYDNFKFSGISEHIFSEKWADLHSSMCVPIDANRTLSQLS